MLEKGSTADRNSKIQDKMVEIGAKVGNQIHLRSLRDGMSVLMPLFILAGLGVLINFVVIPYAVGGLRGVLNISNPDAVIAKLQIWGSTISRGTLDVTGLLMAPCIGYAMSKNRGFSNPLSASVIALVSLITLLPLTVSIVPNGKKIAVDIGGVLTTNDLGSKAMITGIIVGLLSAEIFVKLTKIKKMKVNLGPGVPPMVAEAFSSMFPAMITISIFALISAILQGFFNTDLITLIVTMIQTPLRSITTSLAGYLFLYSSGNLLFTIGIHQSVITGTFTDPFLLINQNENMAAFANHAHVPNIITTAFQIVYPQMGGTGATISLLLAIFLFSRYKASRDLGKLALAPGLFEINEPIIFGFPIIYNLPMIIPFILLPIFNALVGYFATSIGLVSKTVVMVPWVTPPVISGFLATAGDWRTPILQIILIIAGAFIYLPFMRVSEAVSMKLAKEKQEKEDLEKTVVE